MVKFVVIFVHLQMHHCSILCGGGCTKQLVSNNNLPNSLSFDKHEEAICCQA